LHQNNNKSWKILLNCTEDPNSDNDAALPQKHINCHCTKVTESAILISDDIGRQIKLKLDMEKNGQDQSVRKIN